MAEPLIDVDTMQSRREHDREHRPVPAHRLRELAVQAQADPRTVQRELREPGSVRGIVGDRVRTVLREQGLISGRANG
jgi:hypothetical protein